MNLTVEQARELIIDRYRNPKNYRETSGQFKSYLALDSCADKITVFADVQNNLLKNVSFIGKGCAIMTASADLMIDILVNKDILTINKILEEYKKMLHGKDYNDELLGPLVIFKNVYRQPNRIECGMMIYWCIKDILKK